MLAHRDLLAKRAQGQIDVYFVGNSITRRWGATDYPDFLANWKENFFGWNAADFGWGADRIENMLWRIQHGELDGVNPKVIVILGGTNNVGSVPGGDEKIAIVVGLETVCIELAARFTVDMFEDRYFGWDPSRFASRREHNLVRARGQLALGRQVAAARPELLDLVLAGS